MSNIYTLNLPKLYLHNKNKTMTQYLSKNVVQSTDGLIMKIKNKQINFDSYLYEIRTISINLFGCRKLYKSWVMDVV